MIFDDGLGDAREQLKRNLARLDAEMGMGRSDAFYQLPNGEYMKCSRGPVEKYYGGSTKWVLEGAAWNKTQKRWNKTENGIIANPDKEAFKLLSEDPYKKT